MTDLEPTTPRAGAPFVGWGLVLSLVGLALLGAAAYVGMTASGDPRPHPGVGLAAAGWVTALPGFALLGVGAFRLAQHADRAAGVRYPRARPADYSERTPDRS